jgi:predicted dehydrogenase
MRRLVADGTLGRVYHAEARWMARWTGFLVDPRTSWRVRPEQAGGGILIGRGSHLIDAMLHVLGHPRVEAVEATVSSRLTPHAIDDGASATFHLAGGSTLTIGCSYLAHLAGRREEMSYELLGDQGGAAWRQSQGAVAFGSAGRCDMATGAWTELSPCPAADADALEPRSILADFLGAVATGHDPCVTGEQAALVVDLITSAYRAASEGRRLAVAARPAGSEFSG